MKKVKLSLAALALIVAIVGTTTVNANSKEAEPCSKVDPKLTFCLDQWPVACCEDGNQVYNEPFPL
jgi:hypothetical protein